MNKMYRAAVLVLAAVLATTNVKAQNPDTLRLDLDYAIELGLSDNPTIKAGELEIRRFDYVRREAVANHLPQLSAGGQFSYNVVKQEMSKGLSLGADMSAAVQADLTIPLIAPQIWVTLKMTRVQKELAVEQARSSRIDLVNAVKKSFYQILLLEKSYDVLRESEQTVAETVDNTRTMYRAGLASEYDLLTAEVQLSNLAPNLINMANSIGIAKQMLKMYLSIPEEVEIALVGSLDDFRAQTFDEIPDSYFGVENNSELRQLEHQQSLVKQQIRLARAARAPTVAAFGNIVFTGQDKTTNFGAIMMGGNGTTDKWWWQHPAVAGVQISVPIFAGFKNRWKAQQYKNTYTQLGLQMDYLREAKQVEARSAINNIVSARETMLANEKTVEQAEKAYSISRTRFRAGAGTMLEVNQAQLAVTQARMNHSQAIYDYLAARADYDKVIGVE